MLSPLHIMADEVLHVKVRSKHRLHLYNDSYSDSHGRVSFPVRTLSPSYHSIRTSIPSLPLASSNDKSAKKSTGTPPKLKRAGSLSPTVGHGSTGGQRQLHDRLQRKSGGVTIQYEGGLRRRGSYSGVTVASGASTQLPTVRRSTTHSSPRENLVPQPSPSPLVSKGLSISTSSLAQDYELLSPDDGFHTPGKMSSIDGGRALTTLTRPQMRVVCWTCRRPPAWNPRRKENRN